MGRRPRRDVDGIGEVDHLLGRPGDDGVLPAREPRRPLEVGVECGHDLRVVDLFQPERVEPRDQPAPEKADSHRHGARWTRAVTPTLDEAASPNHM